MLHAEFGEGVGIENRVDGHVDTTDVHVEIVHQVGMEQVASVELVGHVEHQTALLPLKCAHFITPVGQVDATVVGYHAAGLYANEHRVARHVYVDFRVFNVNGVEVDVPEHGTRVGGIHLGGVAQQYRHVGICQRGITQVDVARVQVDEAGI